MRYAFLACLPCRTHDLQCCVVAVPWASGLQIRARVHGSQPNTGSAMVGGASSLCTGLLNPAPAHHARQYRQAALHMHAACDSHSQRGAQRRVPEGEAAQAHRSTLNFENQQKEWRKIERSLSGSQDT